MEGVIMKMYRENNLDEWSRKLMTMHGVQFRKQSTPGETLNRWADRLTNIYNKRFVVKKSEHETLHDWSKMIGG